MPSYCPRTGKCEADVVIQHDNFPHCTRILQLENRLLFYPQYRYILAAYPDLNNINAKCRQQKKWTGTTYSAGSFSLRSRLANQPGAQN